MQEVSVFTDGASRGNPGRASIAYVIKGLADQDIEHYEAIGQTTNNQAEYRALVAALECLSQKAVTQSDIQIFSDSELMVRQIIGEYKVKDPNLRPHFQRAQTLIGTLESSGCSVSITAVRRERNQRADQLANIALDQSR